MDNATRYFSKVTNRELYKYVNILECIDDEYVITNKISDTNIKEMRSNMDATDAEEFDKFVERVWGSENKAKTVSVNPEQEPKKRGRKPKLV